LAPKARQRGSRCGSHAADYPPSGALSLRRRPYCPNSSQQDADCGPNAICGTTAGGLCCNARDQAQVNICLPLCPTTLSGKSNNVSVTDNGTGPLLGLRDRLFRH
jgi:hypothetical protein